MINGGKGPNRTVERIILESPLVQVYRNIQMMIEQTFDHTHRSTNHTDPIMTKTFQKLLEKLTLDSPHTIVAGRKTRHEIVDMHDKGRCMMEQAMRGEEENTGCENEGEGVELSLDDIIVDLLQT